MKKQLIYDLDLNQTRNLISSLNEPPYRALQIWEGLYRNGWTDANQFSALPVSLRDTLADNFTFHHLQPITIKKSSDGLTRKFLFVLPDGNFIETVLMNQNSDRHGTQRISLCVSTQAGCAIGCVFCATGHIGFNRNLTSGEIIEQVIYSSNELRAEGKQITNIIYMGMGEPFHNYDETVRSLEILNSPEGLKFGARRITVSTIGLLPGIKRFSEEKRQVNLAVSLHAADDELRDRLIPINSRYSLNELMHTCLEYIRQTHRRITFEWVLIEDINDTEEQALKLVSLLKPFNYRNSWMCHVNIIPLNPTDHFNGHSPSAQKSNIFRNHLNRAMIPNTLRVKKGVDINAGCGQLAGEG